MIKIEIKDSVKIIENSGIEIFNFYFNFVSNVLHNFLSLYPKSTYCKHNLPKLQLNQLLLI